MFTGIVEEMGSVTEISNHRLVIRASSTLEGVALGDSIAVNGTCLTVVEFTNDSFAMDLSQETLDRTALGALSVGSPVDLERALTPTSRMGGHFVQGHVDGVGTVTAISGTPEARVMSIQAPRDIDRYIVEKGFITVEGISLTVTGVVDSTFSIAVIPYTWEHTVLSSKVICDAVNLEVDIVAKYVERLLPARPEIPDQISRT
ncbi:MAG: riboflavin synthase [Chloroflexi bacterium]|nr:riboflavin synthase [Chloroflexota bacterium]